MSISYRIRVGCTVAGCVALLGVAGCTGNGGSTASGGHHSPAAGGHTAAPPPTPTPTPTPSTTPPGTATTGPAPTGGARGVATCATGQLRIALGQRNGAMGSAQVQLVFTNTGGRTCVEAGYPGVSFVTGDRGTQVGSPAKRRGGGYSTVTVAPGRAAHATFQYPQVGNIPAGSCRPTTVRGLRVYPPDQRTSVYVPLAVRACTTGSAGVPGIAPMQPGTGTQA